MAYRAFRVTNRVQWAGWVYAPTMERSDTPEFDVVWQELLDASDMTQRQRADVMKARGCRDERSVDPAIYGGDILIADEGPRLDTMLSETRKFVYDAAIPPVDELLKQDEYKRLLSPPKVLTAAGR